MLVAAEIGLEEQARARSEHPTWGEPLGSLIALVGLALALRVVDTLAVQTRTAAGAR